MKESFRDIPRNTLEAFYDDPLAPQSTSVIPDGRISQHFCVFSHSEHSCDTEISENRRDYYKIVLLTKGSGIFSYDGQSYKVQQPTMAFINPTSMLSWQDISPAREGYYCIFRESFFQNHQELLNEIKNYPLFQVGNNPLLILSENQLETVEHIYQQMISEYTSSQPRKTRMLMLQLQQMLLEGRRMCDQKETKNKEQDAAHRHTRQFLRLLEDQFPIASIHQRITLNSPAQFADELSLHANHLNTQVKKVTEQSVRTHIQNRLLLEARLLLTHTDWPVADIAFCLGFDEPASFSHFVKRHTEQTPSSFRVG